MKQKEILIISITILLTIGAWILAEIYHVTITEKVKFISPQASQPVNVNIEVNIFDRLEKKLE